MHFVDDASVVNALIGVPFIDEEDELHISVTQSSAGFSMTYSIHPLDNLDRSFLQEFRSNVKALPSLGQVSTAKTVQRGELTSEMYKKVTAEAIGNNSFLVL